ncbi:hypothetical protein RRG08_051657 [Elysia crispata]|uniref:Uncharacterized protein n=1 Tax=Elysia crispata TaxID=231223 RepID=A0AAE1DRG9_9GAST|nr:hypothetical protein RRG08_051657 [Elysia crispata]
MVSADLSLCETPDNHGSAMHGPAEAQTNSDTFAYQDETQVDDLHDLFRDSREIPLVGLGLITVAPQCETPPAASRECEDPLVSGHHPWSTQHYHNILLLGADERTH